MPLAIVCRQPASLIITEVAYDFLSLLPNTEPLRTRGRRLHDTPQQRLGKVYAPDLLIKVDVEDAGHRLSVNFADDGDLVFAQGECKQLRLWLSNEGTEEVGEVWMVAGVDDHVWVDEDNIGTFHICSLLNGPFLEHLPFSSLSGCWTRGGSSLR